MWIIDAGKNNIDQDSKDFPQPFAFQRVLLETSL